MADKVLIVGHKNPDNDAISAAVAMAYFENELAKLQGRDTEYEAVRLGPCPPETAWNLGSNGISEPRLIESVGEGDKVIMVDHSEYGQAVDGLKDAQIVGVVDHHRLGDITTAAPLYMTVRPWGSSATVVTSIMRDHGIEIPVDIAHILLGAILTDTVIEKSPTTTPHDAMQIAYLEEITGKERVNFGQELFRCRGREDEIHIKDYVEADSKEFTVAGKPVLIAQHETVDFEAAMAREEEARKHMQHLIAQHGYDFVLLFVTDILEEGSSFLVEGNHEIPDQVFGIDSSEAVWMPGVLSRKKQVAAPLLEV